MIEKLRLSILLGTTTASAVMHAPRISSRLNRRRSAAMPRDRATVSTACQQPDPSSPRRRGPGSTRLRPAWRSKRSSPACGFLYQVTVPGTRAFQLDLRELLAVSSRESIGTVTGETSTRRDRRAQRVRIASVRAMTRLARLRLSWAVVRRASMRPPHPRRVLRQPASNSPAGMTFQAFCASTVSKGSIRGCVVSTSARPRPGERRTQPWRARPRPRARPATVEACPAASRSRPDPSLRVVPSGGGDEPHDPVARVADLVAGQHRRLRAAGHRDAHGRRGGCWRPGRS